MKKFLVTGGAGFIGSAVVRMLVRDTAHEVMVVDKLTYAGNLDSPQARRATARAIASSRPTLPIQSACGPWLRATGRM